MISRVRLTNISDYIRFSKQFGVPMPVRFSCLLTRVLSKCYVSNSESTTIRYMLCEWMLDNRDHDAFNHPLWDNPMEEASEFLAEHA